MGLRVGIVGLPNVGKSTLFNALILNNEAPGKPALVENRPFTTVEPNVGVVEVPDGRLPKLVKLAKSEKYTPSTIEFVDIAGLVKNAHQGEGLGNQFLSHIRGVDAIVHVVRFFDDPSITHVTLRPAQGTPLVDPSDDANTIETELALADLQLVQRALEHIRHGPPAAKARPRSTPDHGAALRKLYEHLAAGRPARTLPLTKEELTVTSGAPLLTLKPCLFVANVSESRIRNADAVVSAFAKQYAPVVALSLKFEQELAELPPQEQSVFLKEYGLQESGLTRLVQATYQLLNLITFFTANRAETHAWAVPAGTTAPQAAGKVHTDMARGFIRAEVIAFDDLSAAGSYAAARAAGKVRDEGKEYTVKDGDILLFKFSG